MENRKLLFISIVISVILLIPAKIYYKDGGSFGYKSMLYEVINYDSIDGKTGIEIKILGMEVYSNVEFADRLIFAYNQKRYC